MIVRLVAEGDALLPQLRQLRGVLSALEVGGDQYDPGHVSSGSMRRWLRTALSKLT